MNSCEYHVRPGSKEAVQLLLIRIRKQLVKTMQEAENAAIKEILKSMISSTEDALDEAMKLSR